MSTWKSLCYQIANAEYAKYIAISFEDFEKIRVVVNAANNIRPGRAQEVGDLIIEGFFDLREALKALGIDDESET